MNLSDIDEIDSSKTPTETTTEKNFGKIVIDDTNKFADDMGIPPWGLVTIIIIVCIVILGILFFCIRRCCRKRRGKDGKKGMKGVDLKSVQLLGSAYKEKVIISIVVLIGNFEEKIFRFSDKFRYSLIWKN